MIEEKNSFLNLSSNVSILVYFFVLLSSPLNIDSWEEWIKWPWIAVFLFDVNGKKWSRVLDTFCPEENER